MYRVHLLHVFLFHSVFSWPSVVLLCLRIVLLYIGLPLSLSVCLFFSLFCSLLSVNNTRCKYSIALESNSTRVFSSAVMARRLQFRLIALTMIADERDSGWSSSLSARVLTYLLMRLAALLIMYTIYSSAWIMHTDAAHCRPGLLCVLTAFLFLSVETQIYTWLRMCARVCFCVYPVWIVTFCIYNE